MIRMVDESRTLRLIWPQWQGAGKDNVAFLLPQVPMPRARLAYAVGARVLDAVLPRHEGPTEWVSVPSSESPSIDGIESRGEVIHSLQEALAALSRHELDRVLTLGASAR